MRKGLAQRPGDPFLLTLNGEALRRDGQLPAAEKALRAAVDADADQPEPYVNLGVLLANQGRSVEVVKMFEAALNIDTNQSGRGGEPEVGPRGRPVA